MEIWYRTGGYRKNLIEPVNVVKATDKTLTIRDPDWNGKPYESRSAITSSYCQHFRTWDEARAHLMEKSERRIESLRRELEAEKSRLGNIRGLKKPATD